MQKVQFTLEGIQNPDNPEQFTMPKFFGLPEDRAEEIGKKTMEAFKRPGTSTHSDIMEAYETADPKTPNEEAYFWHIVGQILFQAQEMRDNPMYRFARMMEMGG
jgi:hypothetical protein